MAAFRWVAEHAAELGADPERIAVGGDSAGGNLSAALCQGTRDDACRPIFQLLAYPALDLSRETASFELFAEGFILTRSALRWFRDHYLPNVSDRSDPRASPLLAEDLSGLPPARVVTAGFDILRDEGEAYATRLAQAGVAVQQCRYPELTHGFLSMAGRVGAARRALDETAAALRAALNG